MIAVERMLSRIEKNTVVEILFSNGGACCSSQSDYMSDKEVTETKNNIVKLIRIRAKAHLEELQKEFNDL